MCEMVAIHRWENRTDGRFKAPFAYIGMFSMPCAESFGMNISGYNNALEEASRAARSYGVSMGSCDICGTGIHNHFVIKDATGRNFVVGCDCVMKTDDTKLITAVEKAERDRKRAIRKAANDAKWERIREERIAAEAAERAANGGKTLREIEADKRAAELAAKTAKHTSENMWLIKVLDSMPGDFCASMSTKLESNPIGDLSDRCIEIMADIYAKSVGGRSGSKKYAAAIEDFYAKANIAIESDEE